MGKMKHILFVLIAVSALGLAFASSEQRPRLREFGITTGILSPGPLNAITDVAGVKVGQVTLIEGDSIRTGVTLWPTDSAN
jgi:D-aminopeptidase